MLLGSGVFIFFETLLKTFLFLKNGCTDFQKSVSNGKSAHSFVCLHNTLVLFYLTPLSTAFEKLCGVIFDQIFQNFLNFLENYPSKSEFFGATGKLLWEAPLHMRFRPIFSTKNYGPQKSRTFDFSTVFSKTTFRNLRFWFQEVEHVVRSSSVWAVMPKFFYTKT